MTPPIRSQTPLAACLLLLLAGCGGDQPPGGHQAPPPAVGVAAPLRQVLPVTRALTGRIEATDAVEIKPQVAGAIVRVLVADGAEVEEGQALFEIDSAPFAASVKRAEAQLAQAEAQLAQATAQSAQVTALYEQAVTTRDRNARLVRENVVSQQAYDDSVSTASAAEAGLNASRAAMSAATAAQAAAQAALVTAKLDLSHASVTAPIAGRLGRIQTTVGNLVQGGGAAPATTLASLVSVDPVYVVFDLDEATYRRIAPRLTASVAGTAQVPVEVMLAGEDAYQHRGAVTFVDNRVDALSGAIRLRARLDNPQRVLTPGAFARVRIEVEPPRPVLLINEQAVLAQLTTRYVLTVDGHGVTAFRPVALGAAHGALREVEQGLGPDDLVAVTNLAKVFFPGMPVQPRPVAMDTLAPAPSVDATAAGSATAAGAASPAAAH